MTRTRSTRSTSSWHGRGWSVALVVFAGLMYALLPAVYATHMCVAHGDHAEQDVLAAAAVDCESSSTDGHSDHGLPNRDGPHCDLCRLIATLGASGDAPSPVASVTIDVTSVEYAFAPEELFLPADLRAAPASPRAPPRL